jgi:hypothetical protein
VLDGRHAIAIVGLLLACGEDGGATDEPPAKLTATEGTTDLPIDTSTGDAEIEGDRCPSAMVVRDGHHVVALRGALADFRNQCGPGGPELFFQVPIERRVDLEVEAVGAGFVPIVTVLESCDDTEALACAEGLPVQVLDLAIGSAPIVVVAIDGEDPALAEEGDALDVAVDLRFRAVLTAGEECSPPGRGRCESGSACLPDPDGVERCTALAADTCATAEPRVIAVGEPLVVEIDPGTPQTDAHEHSCTGARRRDRVLELELPADMPAAASLRVSTDDADVGLAVRRATCLSDDELACAQPSDGGSTLIVDDMPVALGSDRTVDLFIELPIADADPSGPGELPPLVVTIELAGP